MAKLAHDSKIRGEFQTAFLPFHKTVGFHFVRAATREMKADVFIGTLSLVSPRVHQSSMSWFFTNAAPPPSAITSVFGRVSASLFWLRKPDAGAERNELLERRWLVYRSKRPTTKEI